MIEFSLITTVSLSAAPLPKKADPRLVRLEKKYGVKFFRTGEGLDSVQKNKSESFTDKELKWIEKTLEKAAKFFGLDAIQKIGFTFVKVYDPKQLATVSPQGKPIRYSAKIGGGYVSDFGFVFGKVIELRRYDFIPPMYNLPIHVPGLNRSSFNAWSVSHCMAHVIDGVIRGIKPSEYPPDADKKAEYIRNMYEKGGTDKALRTKLRKAVGVLEIPKNE